MFLGLLRNFRLVKKRANIEHIRDYKKWRNDFEASRTQHREDFWEIQTEVENDWINSYNRALLKKFYKRSTSNRDAVIRIANRTTELAEERAEKQKQKDSAKKLRDEEYSRTLLRKQELVQIMNIESSKWITIDNYKEKITENLIIPENLDHSSYYAQLRESSEVAGLGKLAPFGSDFNNKEETEIKNRMIVPIFANVRSAIKRLSYTPLQPLFEDFEAAKSRLYSYPSKIEEISKVYRAIAQAWKDKEKKDVNVYLTRLIEQVNLLTTLITEWNQYITITKYDDQELRLASFHMIQDEHTEAELKKFKQYDFELFDNEEIDREPDKDEGDILSRKDAKERFENPNPESSDLLDHELQLKKDKTNSELEKLKGHSDEEKDKSSELSSSDRANFNSASDSASDSNSDSDGKKAKLRGKNNSGTGKSKNGELNVEGDKETDIRIDTNKIISNLEQETDFNSDFDMYKGVRKDKKEEDLSFIDKVVNETVKEENENKEHEEELEFVDDRDKFVDVEMFTFNPTYAAMEIKQRVNNIDEELLSQEGLEKKYLILELLENLMKNPIYEPHLLVKVYKYHRYDPPVFK